MNIKIRFVPAAMIVLFVLVAASIPSTSTVEIRELSLVREVQPTVTLAAGTRHHTNHKVHKNEDPGFAAIGGGAVRPEPQVSL